MKNLFIILIFLLGVNWSVNSQIANYNQYPSLHNYKMLDTITDSLSFAFSMRHIHTSYTGPLVRLRRASDNAEMDFYRSDTSEIVDVNLINTWRGVSNVFVVIWYDQSGLGRNAVEATATKQPRFIPDPALPYFFGDGADDGLTVNTSIMQLTNNGDDGTVLGVIYATKRNQVSFGSSSGGERWLTHLSWGNGQTFFDPGGCCNNPRSFIDPANQWNVYTFWRGGNIVTARRDGALGFSGTFGLTNCNANIPFGILYAGGSNNSYATNRFTELIMYKYGTPAARYQYLENNMLTFWNL